MGCERIKVKARELKAKVRARNQAKRASLPTANARIIRDLMVSKGIKGNYKDFTILAGGCLVDWMGSYPLEQDPVKGVQLVHKRRLEEVVGPEVAERFWSKATGQRRVVNRKS